MAWLGEPDVQGWVDASRLNVLKGIAGYADPDRLAELQGRFLEAAGPAYARLDEWAAEASPEEQGRMWDSEAAA
jgi:hypothetical protein